MSTVYTVNGKVLKNSANYKWLTKKEAPAGFVMNARNVVNTTGIGTGTGGIIAWEGPNYPNTCNLSGKTLQVKITSTITANNNGSSRLMYSSVNNSGGPNIAAITETQPGTYTYVCDNNPAESSFGKYLTLELGNISDIDKIELTILD